MRVQITFEAYKVGNPVGVSFLGRYANGRDDRVSAH